MEENKQKRTAWNKGRKQTIKKLNYTNGIKNIKVAEGENPPEGFYRGQVRHMSEEEFNKNKKIQVQKTIETKIAKYGSTSYNNIEKRKQTCLQKYGSEQYTASEDFKNKSEQTCLEKYGVKNPMQSKEMQKLYRDKLKEKFGVENVSQLDSSKEKVRDT